MLKAAHEAATGKQLPPPDDVMDAQQGAWKEAWYGSRDVFVERKARLRLLTEYGLNPINQVHLILEGLTETVFTQKVAPVVGIDLEALGVEVHNLEGVGGLKYEHLWRLLWHAVDEGAVAYVVVDNDDQVMAHTDDLMRITGPRGEPLLRKEFRTIWAGEFEEDNFSLEEIVESLNRLLKSKGVAAQASVEELRKHLTSDSGKPKKVTKALKDLAWAKAKFDLEGHRERLAEVLAQIAIEKIDRKVAELGSYEPVTKMETELRKVARLAHALGIGARLENASRGD